MVFSGYFFLEIIKYPRTIVFSDKFFYSLAAVTFFSFCNNISKNNNVREIKEFLIYVHV